MRRRVIAIPLIAIVISALGTAPASAQKQYRTAVLGGAVGAGAGGYIALSIIVAESRAGRYMHSFSDALGWHSVPVLGGGAAGVALGWTDPDRLLHVAEGGTAGALVGLAAGIPIGKAVWHAPEGKWAGGAIGAGAGMALGCLVGILLPVHHDNGDPRPAEQTGVPIMIRVRF